MSLIKHGILLHYTCNILHYTKRLRGRLNCFCNWENSAGSESLVLSIRSSRRRSSEPSSCWEWRSRGRRRRRRRRRAQSRPEGSLRMLRSSETGVCCGTCDTLRSRWRSCWRRRSRLMRSEWLQRFHNLKKSLLAVWDPLKNAVQLEMLIALYPKLQVIQVHMMIL